MILPNLAKASMGLVEKQKNLNKDTTVGSVAPHSHDSSKDSAQQIPPIAPPQPDNITGNLTNNQIIQDKGKALWQGEQMANQFATRQMDQPVPPPGDPTGDQYGNMFSPFSQKKIVKGPVPQRPHIKPEGVPKVAKEQKVWKKGGKGVNMNGDQYGNMFSPFSNKPVEKKEIVQEKLPTERVVKRQRHEQKMEKPREMPKKVIPPTKMIGGVKKAKDPNKGKAYVVNKRPNVWQEGTVDRSKDTLWLDNSYKKMAGSYIDQDDYDDLARKAHSEGSYKRVGVQDLEGGGEIKKKI